MRQLTLIVLLAAVVLVGAAVVFLGAFPPRPHTQPVDHVLPNDRFGTH